MTDKIITSACIVLFLAVSHTAAYAQENLTPITSDLSDWLYKQYLQSRPGPFEGKVPFCLEKPTSSIPGIVSFVGTYHEIEGNPVFVPKGCRIPLYRCEKDGTLTLIDVKDYSQGDCPVSYKN